MKTYKQGQRVKVRLENDFHNTIAIVVGTIVRFEGDYWIIEIPIKAAIEVIASLLWCQASARNEELFDSLLLFITNRNEYSFHKIITPRMMSVHFSGNLCGVLIFMMLSYAIMVADVIKKTTTKNVIKGSARP